MPEKERREGFDEVSLLMGAVKEAVSSLKETNVVQWEELKLLRKELKSLNTRLTNQSIKVAGIAGGISAAIVFVPHALKFIFSRGGQ